MANETGDMKLLGNFRKLIDRVKNEPDYKPSNAALTTAAMEPHYAAGVAVVQELTTHTGTAKLTVSEREVLFEDLKPLMTRVHSLVKASGAPPSVIEDLSSFKRKLSGGGKSSKAKGISTSGVRG